MFKTQFKSNVWALLAFSLALVGLTIWSVTSAQNFYVFDLLYGQDVTPIKRLELKSINEASPWQQKINFHQKSGTYLLRGEVDLANASDKHLGMLVVLQASYKLYWDGQLIETNGVVGDSKTSEVPGKMNNTVIIPRALTTQGKHQVLFQLSNYHRSSANSFRLLLVGTYDQLTQRPLIFTAILYILAGSFFTIAIYYLLLYLIAYRQASLLVFGMLSLCFCLLTLFEHSKPIYQYPYPWHLTRLMIIDALSYAISYLIVLFFLLRFQPPRQPLILLVLTLLLVSMHQLNFNPEGVFYMYISALFIALLIIIRAMWQKQRGSLEAFSGILACFISLNYYDLTLFLGFFGLIVFMLISLSIQLKAQQQTEKNALLRSSRLEIELLKKQLQPHFLMNTLTSVIGWIEAEPATSVKLIEALADELKILLQIASEKLITLSQEIALCQAHIAVMRYRKNTVYTLEVQYEKEDVMIPPAIFHTLLENGITHSDAHAGGLVFMLKQQLHAQGITYVFTSKHRQSKNEITTTGTNGTGHRYIKARLDESFSGRWEFYSENTPNGWQDVIHLKK
ncbi:histidine kinase [Microscilla marina]|uniref:Histidine kinase family n=1 Tax=Microscilla marina ATCC 23134 TaxID=313606 RepID=A1ZRN1_MICM2|nr:sensor histidine kinase [Microscilla marina]EAY26936.1 histidine kinase family [Microscilla marina ATCC 23134]